MILIAIMACITTGFDEMVLIAAMVFSTLNLLEFSKGEKHVKIFVVSCKGHLVDSMALTTTNKKRRTSDLPTIAIDSMTVLFESS